MMFTCGYDCDSQSCSTPPTGSGSSHAPNSGLTISIQYLFRFQFSTYFTQVIEWLIMVIVVI